MFQGKEKKVGEVVDRDLSEWPTGLGPDLVFYHMNA